MKNNNTGERIAVLTSHFTRSTPMASEKEAALAATPPDSDSPT
ncbi:14 kDa zinc-binding protein, partial [Trifolium pratense]